MSSTQEVGEIFGDGSGPAHAMLRSPTVLIAAVGLWGMNLFLFRLFGIDYVKVLKYDLLRIDKKEDPPQANNSSVPSSPSSEGIPKTILIDASSGHSSPNNNIVEEDVDDVETSIMGVANNKPPAHTAVTANRLIAFSCALLVMLHGSSYMWIDVMHGGTIGAVFAFYGAVTLYIVFPLPATAWLRKATTIVLHRCYELVHPRCSCIWVDNTYGPRPIPFVDVFFADAMCSLSKVFFDWGMLFHMALHFPHPVPAAAHNILIPSACAAVPYLIRARQCLIMYTVGRIKQDPKRFQHIANAIKYSTSIFPLLLSAYQKTIDDAVAAKYESLLIVLLIINASYSLYWDIVMDWGMMQNPTAAAAKVVCAEAGSGGGATSPAACLRNRLRYGVAMSVAILTADCVLRFSWTLRFYTALFPSGDSFVLCTQFLEVFRRALWNLLRVEWENLKQLQKTSATTKNTHETAASSELVFLTQPTTNMKVSTA